MLNGTKREQWLEKAGIERIRRWAGQGLGIYGIAEEMGVSHQTLYRWRSRYPQIARALKAEEIGGMTAGGEGERQPATDGLVQEALLKNAVGYSYTEQVLATRKEVQYLEGRRVREVSEPVVVDLERFRPGETKAQEFWLRNRLRDSWRDKPEEQEEADALEAARELLEGVDSAF